MIGCRFLSISNSPSVIMNNSQFQNINSDQSASVLYLNNIFNFQLDQNLFDSCISKNNAGAIYIFQSSQLFESNIFKINQSAEGSGGAIFLNNFEAQQMQKNVFQQNSAQIGGAIRYIGIQLSAIQQLKQLKEKKYQQAKNIKDIQDIYFKNKAYLNGQNIGSYQVILDIKYTFEDDDRKSIAQITNIQSGSTANPILLIFIDEETREISFFNISKLPSLNQSTLSFNDQTMSVQIILQFRSCQRGEIIQSIQQFQICLTCQKGFYSLEGPHQSKYLQCQKCAAGSLDCYADTIIIENGYWRNDKTSDQIYECINPQNCKSEMPESINRCAIGYMGALRESCDIYGKVWGNSYGKSNDKIACVNCSQQLLGVMMCQDQQTTLKSSYSKILIDYVQFLVLINSLGIQYQTFLSAFEIGGGDTFSYTIFNLDCTYKYISDQLPPFAMRVIW
ncbi:hypothetical protein ABPG72_013596, partial [Tetrahymena utriculariae]